MTTLAVSMPYMVMQSRFSNPTESTPATERMAVVGVVVLLHLLLFASFLLQPEAPAVLINEMSISFANMQMQQADVIPQPKPKPREVEPEPVPEDEPVVKEEIAPPVPQTATPPSPVQLDAEPDYRADYLNNPRPPYPRVANKMGWVGKVVLEVEVLSNGNVGDIKVNKSSGYPILDSSALQTVKTWRFIPARRLGQPVTEWFFVPVRFGLLKDSEA